MMPIGLGYWKNEGYDVKVIVVPCPVQAMQKLRT